ncbi:hypothetical protein VE01_02588 [Pseudogymnoascus verrucosus]|uniref:RRM domain-containing protein n=1 Tax=Pseudogymnoascus verrucosus TaxID=342668 RepID=A0A1B8GU39_9PEZI|nr:uncharacterized protein VE01_02588 [Pseudogymnoascus verrucosus]OBT99341.1 hypothetical protein VE01_02588 [Pseudogymnoascus verrucosus]
MAPIKKSAGPRSERKAAKRKAQDAIPDVPEDYNNEGAEEVAAPKKRKRDDDEEGGEDTEESGIKKVRKEKKEKKEKEEGKKEKKEKKPKKDAEGGDEDTMMEDAAPKEPKEPKEDVPKKSKKERKAERKAQQAAEAIANAKANRAAEEAAAASKPTVASDGTEASKPAAAAAAGGKTPKAEKAPKLDKDGNPIKKKNNRNREKKRLAAATAIAAGEKAPARFIVFVGNLPFTATVESITAHFAAVHPISVRNLTQKDDPTKSKGCAFVEFEGYDHMKTCLKTYHHSEFDDGKGGGGRKINVELTAGGGGNTKVRKGKIAEKNEKLMEQRTRRIGEEEKQKLVKRGVPEEDQSGIHPSRRARVA